MTWLETVRQLRIAHATQVLLDKNSPEDHVAGAVEFLATTAPMPTRDQLRDAYSAEVRMRMLELLERE